MFEPIKINIPAEDNLYHYLSQLISTNDIERAVYKIMLLEEQDLKDN